MPQVLSFVGFVVGVLRRSSPDSSFPLCVSVLSSSPQSAFHNQALQDVAEKDSNKFNILTVYHMQSHVLILEQPVSMVLKREFTIDGTGLKSYCRYTSFI